MKKLLLATAISSSLLAQFAYADAPILLNDGAYHAINADNSLAIELPKTSVGGVPKPGVIVMSNSDLVLSGDSAGLAGSIFVTETGSSESYSVEIRDTSAFRMDGGQLDLIEDSSGNAAAFVTTGNARATIMNGTVTVQEDKWDDALGFIAKDGSTVDINGGEFIIQDEMWGSSLLFRVMNNATVNVWGGEHSMTETLWDDALLFEASDNASVNIFGGEFELNEISWGSKLSYDFAAKDLSTVTIYGTDFNYAYGEVSDEQGNISGTLLDGSAFDFEFSRDAGAKIILVKDAPLCGPIGGTFVNPNNTTKL